jgi:hypothetical protein
LKTAALQIGRKIRQSRDIPARPRQAFDDARANGIAHSHEDNRDTARGRRRGGLCSHGAKSGDENIGLHADKLGRKSRQKLGPSFGRTIFEMQALALDVTKLVKAAHEACHEAHTILARQQRQVTKGDCLGSLRIGRGRAEQDGACKRFHQRASVGHAIPGRLLGDDGWQRVAASHAAWRRLIKAHRLAGDQLSNHAQWW